MDVEDWLNSNITLCKLQVVSETNTANIKVRSDVDFLKVDGPFTLC